MVRAAEPRSQRRWLRPQGLLARILLLLVSVGILAAGDRVQHLRKENEDLHTEVSTLREERSQGSRALALEEQRAALGEEAQGALDRQGAQFQGMAQRWHSRRADMEKAAGEHADLLRSTEDQRRSADQRAGMMQGVAQQAVGAPAYNVRIDEVESEAETAFKDATEKYNSTVQAFSARLLTNDRELADCRTDGQRQLDDQERGVSHFGEMQKAQHLINL